MKYIYLITSLLLSLAGQYNLKYGLNRLGGFSLDFSTAANFFKGIFQTIFSPFILLGIFLYACSVIFWLLLLARMELSQAYPLLSINYLLIIFIGWLFLGESFTLNKFVGALLICLGIFILSLK